MGRNPTMAELFEDIEELVVTGSGCLIIKEDGSLAGDIQKVKSDVGSVTVKLGNGLNNNLNMLNNIQVAKGGQISIGNINVSNGTINIGGNWKSKQSKKADKKYQIKPEQALQFINLKGDVKVKFNGDRVLHTILTIFANKGGETKVKLPKKEKEINITVFMNDKTKKIDLGGNTVSKLEIRGSSEKVVNYIRK